MHNASTESAEEGVGAPGLRAGHDEGTQELGVRVEGEGTGPGTGEEDNCGGVVKGPRPYGQFDVSHDAERPSAGEEEQGWRTERERKGGRVPTWSPDREVQDVGRMSEETDSETVGRQNQTRWTSLDWRRRGVGQGGTQCRDNHNKRTQAQDGRRTSRSRMGAPVKPRDGAGSRACVKLVFTRDLVPSGVSGVVQRSKDHPVWVGCSNRGAKSGVVSRCCETAPCDRHVVDRARRAVFSSGAVRH